MFGKNDELLDICTFEVRTFDVRTGTGSSVKQSGQTYTFKRACNDRIICKRIVTHQYKDSTIFYQHNIWQYIGKGVRSVIMSQVNSTKT